ncbi:MAG: Tim44/TimA family putative adaptor protein [Alphaproteobacteria bacterium]
MDGSFIEVVIFAAIAVVVGLRLYQVLGRRTGYQEQRPKLPKTTNGAGDNIVALPDRAAPRAEDGAPADAPSSASLAVGLTQVKLADPSFERESFVAGARAAFEMIVTAFAKSDLAAVKGLLSPAVHDSFTKALADRDTGGRRVETTLVALDDAAIVEAVAERRMARVTVRFVSEQVKVVRDATGQVIEGDSRHADRVVDLWTFERDTRSRDPNWALVATRSAA